MQQETNYLIPSISDEAVKGQASSEPVLNFSEILSQYGIDFKRADSYLEVGDIAWIQGWILDIAVVQTQVASLLECILPPLIRDNTPFIVVRNLESARATLTGELGYATMGKIMSIYPKDSNHANQLALELIALSSSFKGPEILTDRHLGAVVYARYGAGKAIIKRNKNNIPEKYIYNPNGNLIKEPLTIPFHLPEGIGWPFPNIASVEPKKLETVLQDRYRPMAVLKEDAKGSVRKGLWLQKIYKVRWCVLKEGKKYMNSDDLGRDVHDRLCWQYELQKDLEGKVPVPKVFDLFQENGNTYLVMELIQGAALDTAVQDILDGRPWPALSMDERLLLLDYAGQVLDIVATMHGQGYLHRDIMPNNFLVTKQQSIWMIDLELSYSQRLKKPCPPFRLGTPGFMSPEQEAANIPAVEQDIYSIGATLVLVLTGLLPGGFSTEDPEILADQLYFFIRDEEFVNTLVICLSHDPGRRPSIAMLKTSIDELRNRQLSKDSTQGQNKRAAIVDKEILKNAISRALKGLSAPTMMEKDLWFSLNEEQDMAYYQSEATAVYPGFYQGLSGVLCLMAKAHQCGFTISSCMRGYDKSIRFIRDFNNLGSTNLPAGLYVGTAGMALALTKGIDSGLLSRQPALEQDIYAYLKNDDIEGCGIVKGLSGKGLALIHAMEVFTDPGLVALLRDTAHRLLAEQQRDGSWISVTEKNKVLVKVTGYGHGAAGIIFFLLEYLKRYKDENVRAAVVRSLQWLIQQSHKRKGQLLWYPNNKSRQPDTGMINGIPGIILCFIKAFEVLGNPLYRQIAERALAGIPENWIKRDITLATGLTGIGELYLEAAKVFASDEWQTRATWIAQSLLHYTRNQKDGACYWLTEGTPIITPGLLLGNSGVIHFLMRYCKPDQLNHSLSII